MRRVVFSILLVLLALLFSVRCGGSSTTSKTNDTLADTVEAFDIIPGETTIQGDVYKLCSQVKVRVTVNQIPDSMNGSKPYIDNNGEEKEFHLALPTWGFVWDVYAEGCDGNYGKGNLVVWTDGHIEGIEDGANLASYFEQVEPGHFQWRVPQSHPFEQADLIHLYAKLVDSWGVESNEASLAVQIVELTPELNPAQPEDVWLLTFSRDNWKIEVTQEEDGAKIYAHPQSNGTPDFIEDLWIIGLGTDTPADSVEQRFEKYPFGVNGYLAMLLLQRTRQRVYESFNIEPDGTKGPDSVNIKIWIENEDGAPSPDDYKDVLLDEEPGFSILAFGGASTNKQLSESVEVDLWNRKSENNSDVDYGILTTNLGMVLMWLINNDEQFAQLANLLLSQTAPWLGGTPLGTLDEDAEALDLSIPDDELDGQAQSRRAALKTILDMGSLLLAPMVAHEIGHCMGLVPEGAPPYGLFGNEKKAEFVENPDNCEGNHIDTPGLNIMRANADPNIDLNSIAPEQLKFSFNELNMAYLLGRVVVLPKPEEK